MAKPTKPSKAEITLNHYKAAEKVLDRYEDLLANVGAARSNLFRELFDERRDVDAECGYPSVISNNQLMAMHRRNPYARRVNEVMAKEAFQVPLQVRESEDPECPTAFDEDVKELPNQIRGFKSWHRDTRGSSIASVMMRAAIQAAIGHYSVILIGLNDGLRMSEPAAGVEEKYSMPGRYEDSPELKDWVDPYTGNGERGLVVNRAKGVEPTGPYSMTLNEDRNTVLKADPETGQQTRVKGKRTVTYMRVYPEVQAQVTRWEMNRNSPRFGKPVSYQISTVDWNQVNTSATSQGSPATSIDVHWTRVIHIPGRDMNPDETTATPECEPVWNQLMNLDKILGASGEGYWKGAFTPLSIESHPSLGPSPKLNRTEVRNQIENFENSLTRILSLMGVTVKPISVSVMDPTPHIAVNVEAICIKLAIPKRKFMGSERGELSSSEDEGDWNDKLSAYNENYVIPHVAVPLYDRLIMLGALSEPGEDGYTAEFEDISAQSPKEIADIALVKTNAVAAAIAGNVFSAIPEHKYFTSFTGFMEDDEAMEMLEEAEKREEEKLEEDQLLAEEQGMRPVAPEGFEYDDPEPLPFGKNGASKKPVPGGLR